MASDGATATATKSAAPDPLIGRLLAERFQIVSLIARGGMGKVYKAEQAPLGRVCAIKVLNPNYTGDADPEFHRRFFREASITSRITHPNSVTIFDYGKTDDDIYYMAMEYLDGQTLHFAIREVGTMHEYRVGRIAQQICRALREAHRLGVIHRDLKPANIFLTRHGDDEDFVKVLDFGLVKHITERPEEQLTQTGLFMGSPKYMAPEQIQGGNVDARTDVYSLGIMMYEMLAGKVPFERATSVNILMAHVGEPPPPMRAVNPNLVCSPLFEDLVMRCIAKDPAERFETMDEVLQAIKQAHGVSMTGQLAAVNASGPYQPLPTDPPPASFPSAPPAGGRSSMPDLSTGPRQPVSASASASLTPVPIGMLPADGSGERPMELRYVEPARPRSKAWIAVGIVVAAGIGGALGMAAFRLTSARRPPVARATASTQLPGAPAASASGSLAGARAAASVSATSPGSASASSAPAGAGTFTIKVTTDPSGASVRDDVAEVCAATPCEVVFEADAADPSRAHKLVIAHPGFRAETKTVKLGDPDLNVKLARVAGSGATHAPAAPQPAAKPTSETPSGFKDVPY